MKMLKWIYTVLYVYSNQVTSSMILIQVSRIIFNNDTNTTPHLHDILLLSSVGIETLTKLLRQTLYLYCQVTNPQDNHLL
jgi:hypothetical protein